MPVINVKVMENVLTTEQKQEVASRFTDDFADVVGEAVRPLIWVIVEDIRTGQLTVGGDPITTEKVNAVLASEPVPAGAR